MNNFPGAESGYYGAAGDTGRAVREDSHLEYVRPSDVVSGNSQLMMNGSDGYPAYQAVANVHPAVVSTTARFTVTVENETAESGATGTSGTGAEGGGQ